MSDSGALPGQSDPDRRRPLGPRRYVVSAWQRVPITAEVVARSAGEAREKFLREEWEPGSDHVGMGEGGYRGIEVRRDG